MSGNADLFVIGGGPVGLATAIAARRKGFRVTLADGRVPPIDKACGEGMLPDGWPAARLLGLEIAPGESFPVRGIRFCGAGTQVAADFPGGGGFGVRRTTLHRRLVEVAEAAGVELRWGCPVADLKAISARWIVGADGARSQVRVWAGLAGGGVTGQRFGFRLHYRLAPWTNYIEVYWGEGCQIYVTPVAAGEVGVALISRNSKLRVGEALQQFPELKARLEGAEESSAERGWATGMHRLKKVTRGHVALVGDASGMVDAITGEGLSVGFHQALALADALERGDLALYESAHRRLARRPRMMARALLAMDGSSILRVSALRGMAKWPRVFEGLLAMHVGLETKLITQPLCATR